MRGLRQGGGRGLVLEAEASSSRGILRFQFSRPLVDAIERLDSLTSSNRKYSPSSFRRPPALALLSPHTLRRATWRKKVARTDTHTHRHTHTQVSDKNGALERLLGPSCNGQRAPRPPPPSPPPLLKRHRIVFDPIQLHTARGPCTDVTTEASLPLHCVLCITRKPVVRVTECNRQSPRLSSRSTCYCFVCFASLVLYPLSSDAYFLPAFFLLFLPAFPAVLAGSCQGGKEGGEDVCV